MASYATSLKREYLTPMEDEATRQILVTYWQLRNALLEMVNELRVRGARDRRKYDELFLPGYAGALVLVDAARFLRDRFHHWPLVRRKLNEAEPSFGIPAGVYDATQQSWTQPRHIWELFDAAKYYQKHRHQLVSTVCPQEIAQMVCIIEQLAGRLQLSWSDYAQVRLRFRMRQFLSSLKRDLFDSSLFEIQRAAGVLAADRYLRLGHQPSLPNAIREELQRDLLPGDILLVRKEHALTNYFLPGYWPHSALYVGDAVKLESMGLHQHPHVATRWQRFVRCDEPHCGRVIEAMKDGVQIRRLDSPFRSDSILVIRPRLCPDSIKTALVRAFFHEGKEYDFGFDFTASERMVCTEVIYRAYDGIEGLQFPLSLRAGRMTLAAVELVQLALKAEQLEVCATYIPSLGPQLLRGDDAMHAVKQISPIYGDCATQGA
ncbi:MAG: YiiX/YebB-like N1pC/P60 family cysteine hydrolase [Pirellulaceae bacterium]